MSLLKFAKALFGSKNEREVKKLRPLVQRINALEPDFQKLKDDEFIPKLNEFKARHLENGESLDKLLPEVFALVREASVRATGMRHYDVQMIGGIALHQGRIAEMKTGEGKTLVATLPLVLNALSGKGAHLVTVNDYLAKRDAEWMGKIYRFLGLSVGVISHDLSDSQRQENYACDITYGTNNEFGFDYLRDNMKYDLARYVQRPLHYCIIDEVDSILIDEARTPLIISGPSNESTELYHVVDKIIPKLQKGLHYTVDEKDKNAYLTDDGVERVEQLLQVNNLFDPGNLLMLHHVTQALRAHALYKVDRDYMVQGGEILIIDEFTGRALPGRRWSDGLHQAVEAKEKVNIEGENETLATISFQNYFRIYDKMAGMTGTAETESTEFHKTYKMDVLVIPTNKPVIRKDYEDIIYQSEREKFEAVIQDISDCHESGKPVLVGTISIEKSELLHRMLKKRGIPHNVLNAKHHSREAEIVSQAGRRGAVTIATNMAGRGTDIILGGNPEPFIEEILENHKVNPKTIESTIFVKEVLRGNDESARKLGLKLAKISDKDFKAMFEHRDMWKKEALEVREAGGFVIIGTERHDSRRIDNQLRGRAGRQGDPGESRFYLSLEDDLMRRFGSDKLGGVLQTLGLQYGESIEHSMVSKGVENAQKKVEGHNFEIRKHMLEYDDVLNIQRKTVYKLRREILGKEAIREKFLDVMEDVIVLIVQTHCPPKTHIEGWDLDGLETKVQNLFHIEGFEVDDDKIYDAHDPIEAVQEALWESLLTQYETREEEFSPEVSREVEQELYLLTIDELWKEHLKNIERLREGINLQGYRQLDPKLIYKKEAYEMFENLMIRIKGKVLEDFFMVEIANVEEFEQNVQQRREQESAREMHYIHENADGEEDEPQKPETVRRETPKVGRNAPCPCGSGKKYKKCHGKNAA
jgi:preprotein translocase subunit SecA